jgi:23S rRNA pseudouridine955/2504/2580 synthase
MPFLSVYINLSEKIKECPDLRRLPAGQRVFFTSSGNPAIIRYMMQFKVEPEFDGKSLVRVIVAHFPRLPASRIFQALRGRDVRLNGRRLRTDQPVKAGDEIVVYISGSTDTGDQLAGGSGLSDRVTSQPPGDNLINTTASYEIVFQDSLLLIVKKKPGIAVQPARAWSGSSQQAASGPAGEADLLSEIRRDFKDDSIELCHRLDRQTSGLIMLSRQPHISACVLELQKSGKITKRYRCLALGIPDAGTPVVTHDGLDMCQISTWLEKDAANSEVYIHDRPQPGDRPIVTRYRVLRVYPKAGPEQSDVSDLEIELVTGRTHQIRAQLAHMGNQVIGDGKYGRNKINRYFRDSAGKPLTRQQLCATQITFMADIKGPLAYLAGRTFKIESDFDWQP